VGPFKRRTFSVASPAKGIASIVASKLLYVAPVKTTQSQPANEEVRLTHQDESASHRSLALALAATLAWVSGFIPSAKAGTILAGDLVVYRVGDGSAALGTNATPVFLDEYTPAGTLVQTIPLPPSGTDSFTAVGTATTEGIITLSQDKSTLVFTGYRKDAGGTNPSSDAPATTNRVIASVGLSGIVNSSVTLSDTTGTIRSANTVDRSSYYLGLSSGVRYVATPGTAVTSVQIDSRNSREVQLSDNVLYASNGSTTTTSKVQSYGNAAHRCHDSERFGRSRYHGCSKWIQSV
jgi:hypothetical protein